MKQGLLGILLLLAANLFGATYYVKVAGGTGTGLDSNANAWSYAKFNSAPVAAGSTVLFHSGEKFYGTMQAWAGTSGNLVTYGTYGGNGNATLTGFVGLTTWTNNPGTNIYWASLSAPGGAGIQIVTIDGVMKPRGRYPNSGYLTYTSHTANTSITGTTIGALPANFTGGEVVIKKYRYIIDRHPIVSQSGNTINYSNSSVYGNTNNYPPTDGNGYFIQNHLGTLDQNGEWFYDAATSRLYVYMTGGMAGHTVKAANINSLVPFNSIGYAAFNNMNFEGANYAIENNYSAQITFNNCNITQCGMGIYSLEANSFTWNGGMVSEIGSNGIFEEANGSNFTIANATFKNIGLYPGLHASGDGKGCGIAVSANGLNISNNKVDSVGFNGIHVDGNDVWVYQNLVNASNSVKDDGAAYYTYCQPGEVRSNRIFRSNIATNVIGAPDGAGANGDPNGEAAGIYLDGFSNHVTVDSNFIQKGPWMGIMVNANSFHTITNNTTYDYPLGGLLINQIATSGSGSVRGMVIKGNKFIAKNSTDLTMYINLMMVSDNPSSFVASPSDWANNTYARPVSDNQTIQLSRNYSGGNGDNNYTVSAWKTASGLDAGALASAVTTSTTSNLRTDINASTSTMPIVLGAQYKDISGNLYSGTQTLNPYRGNVLVYYGALDAGTSSGGDKVKINQRGKIVIKVSGKMVVTQPPVQIP